MDIVTYKLSQKYADKVAAGFSSVRVDGLDIIFTLNDGKTATVTVPAPKDGEDGVSITNVSLNQQSHLICTLSDGTAIDAGLVHQGIDGKDGKDGADGAPGKDGVDGQDGNGIISIEKTGTAGLVDTYTIYFTNGTTTTFTVTNGSGGGGIDSVIHNETMVGAGTNASPLGVDTTRIALKSEIPDISGKQDTLVSGTNIKTINNQSILGSGNINVEGGGAASSSSLWRSKLSGKKISILGDSISTYQGWLTPSSNAVYYPSCQGSPHADITSVDETWWKIVIDKAQLTLGANNSYSGRKLTESATISNIQALGQNGNPDLILVYLGTNDANQQITLGTIDKTMPFNYNNSETYGETLGTNLTQEQIEALPTDTFYNAVRTLIIRLQWYYPNARIVFLNIGWGSYLRFYADNPYREAIKEVCELMGVDLIDMRKAGINMPKFTNYTLQRVHPNKAGMALLGEYVYNQLMSLYGYTSDETTLISLTYSGTLNKTSYIAGESLDLTGLTFTASYADGTSETLDNSEIEIVPRPLPAGTTSATASYTYGGVKKTVTISGFTVEASTVELTSITSSGTLVKTQYSDGETFDPTGLTFTANFSDSSSRQIEYEALTFSPSPLTSGTTSVTASYTFAGVTKTTTISGITVVAGLSEINELPYATQGVTRNLRGGAVDYIITRPGVSQEELAGKTVKYIEGIYVDNSAYPSESKVLRIGKVTASNIFTYSSHSAEAKQVFENAVSNFEEIATIDLSSYTNKQHFVLNNLNVTFGTDEYLAFDDRNCHCVGFVDNGLTTRLSMVYVYGNDFLAESQLLMPLKIKYED